jgi:antitoxin (DNA-binding transcriptional repressor) of toxin-antitoxin stability system
MRAVMSRAVARKTDGKLARALERVSRGERVVLRRGRKAVAAVVSIQDLKSLQQLENRDDILESLKRLGDPKEKRIPYQTIRRQAGL